MIKKTWPIDYRKDTRKWPTKEDHDKLHDDVEEFKRLGGKPKLYDEKGNLIE